MSHSFSIDMRTKSTARATSTPFSRAGVSGQSRGYFRLRRITLTRPVALPRCGLGIAGSRVGRLPFRVRPAPVDPNSDELIVPAPLTDDALSYFQGVYDSLVNGLTIWREQLMRH